MNKKFAFLFFIIFIEGYIVLSAELLAMRQLIPFVGSGTDTMGIIIAAVLMPLAIGYYKGGQFKTYKKGIKIRQKLLNNIFVATIFLLPGLSSLTIEFFFESLSYIGIHDRILKTTIYSTFFLVVPVYLLAQTIPLISNYFSKQSLSKITGKMLFVSTIGSFMGAVFSTLVLMAYLGIFYTALITLLCLTILYIALSKKNKLNNGKIIMIGFAALAIYLNSPFTMNKMGIITSNNHHTVRILDQPNDLKVLSLNGNHSSGFFDNDALKLSDRANAFKYISYINTRIIGNHKYIGKVRKILVIGAGGFTIGMDDKKNEYTFIDINPELQKITEEHFHKQRLGDNKKFIAQPARGFVAQATKQNEKYDIIIIDAYLGKNSLPEHLLTLEFFESLKEITKNNGAIALNFIGSPTFNNQYSVNLDATLRHAFPMLNRHVITHYNALLDHPKNSANIIYSYHHRDYSNTKLYTDNLNQSFSDKEKKLK